MLLFVLFAIVNFFFFDGVHKFNSYSFVTGALLYVLLFLYDSFGELKKENFNYFTSNNYLLIATPVLFFIGFSFIFGFKNKDIDKIEILGLFTIYNFISYFANITYYTLINIYIYREKKLSNA